MDVLTWLSEREKPFRFGFVAILSIDFTVYHMITLSFSSLRVLECLCGLLNSTLDSNSVYFIGREHPVFANVPP